VREFEKQEELEVPRARARLGSNQAAEGKLGSERRGLRVHVYVQDTDALLMMFRTIGRKEIPVPVFIPVNKTRMHGLSIRAKCPLKGRRPALGALD
jgi:hypothetical protein